MRNHFEIMAQETEEDYQQLIGLLGRFGVTVMRPEIPDHHDQTFVDGKWVAPPTAPRDYFLMIGDRFWVPTVPNHSHAWTVFYRDYKHASWPWVSRLEDCLRAIPLQDHRDLLTAFDRFCQRDTLHLQAKMQCYQHVFRHLLDQGNEIVNTDLDFINGCFVSRIGRDLYFATQTYHDDQQLILEQVNHLFPHTRNHVVNAGGHGDATYCPVTPGLIISLRDIPTYADTFPGWEVLYLPPSNYEHMREFEASMKKAKGRWFMPGFEQDPGLIKMVDYYFAEWVGQVSETVFDVNILVIDKKNIVVSAHNPRVEQICARHGVTVHVIPFRHKYFWDCGIHCITNDLDRQGTCQDFFPERTIDLSLDHC